MNSDVEKPLSMPLLVAALIISLIFAIGSSMTSVRNIFAPNSSERKILAKAFAQYDKSTFVIFKIKTHSGIELEVYEKAEDGQQKFKQRFPLIDDTEAYLMVNSNSMNLGLVDANGDGQLDVIAPTVDKNGNSRLNVFQFNNDLLQFIPYLEEN